MGGGEVLPLQARVGKLLLDGLYEPVDEVVVFGAGHALVAPPEVLGIAQELRVVGSHVEHDRKRPRRGDAADEHVERELSDRNPEAADALIADAQDALAVRDDDDVHLAIRAVSQQLGDPVAERIRDEEAARPPVDVAETLARPGDHRRVDDRDHLFDVVEQQAVEENFVRVLQRPEGDVPPQVGPLREICLVGAAHLLIQRLDAWREQAVKPESGPLLVRKRRALVQGRIPDESDAADAGRRRRRLPLPSRLHVGTIPRAVFSWFMPAETSPGERRGRSAPR